jgi:hypothetical protein
MSDSPLWEASEVFAPDFPRHSSDDGTIQSPRATRSEFVSALERAADAGMPGFYSVYSFPRGHPKEGNIPKIDCVFIDLDIAGDHYDPDTGRTDIEDWRRDMSDLLVRSRMIAHAIMDSGKEEHFRVALSGHKGLHLYLDFPEVHPENGDIGQFKSGLASYGEQVMDWLDDLAGGVNIDPWIDVDASDLARLARHPNTPHHGVEHVEGVRWCVPVTVQELSTIDVDDYLGLTSGPRHLPDGYGRVPSDNAHDTLVQLVRTATPSSSRSSSSARRSQSRRSALKEYKETENDDIELDDVLFLTSDKPCIKAFRQRDDAYDYGDASRAMELSIMGRLLDMNVPVDTIHEFFEPIPGYDRSFTNDLLADLLARGNEYGEFNCETICAKGPRFCLGDSCQIYQRNDDLQK